MLHGLEIFGSPQLFRIIGEHIRQLDGQRIQFHQDIHALLVGRERLVGVVHVRIHISHGVIGHPHPVTVLAVLGIMVHIVHLLKTSTGITREIIEVHQHGPHIIITLPRLMALQQFQCRWKPFSEGVVQFIIIEIYHFLHLDRILLLDISLPVCISEHGIKLADFRGFVSESDNRGNLQNHDDSHSYQPHRLIVV